MGKDNEQEGLSTGKKALAGAAVGIAVPAAVTVAKKLLSGDGDQQQGQQSRQSSDSERSRSGRQGSGSSGRSSASGSKRRSGGSSGSSRSRAKSSASSSSSRARSTASRSTGSRRSGSSGGVDRSNRTKEQLYNQAKRLKIEGRSTMTKQQLERAIERATS
jgi:hypothetical protein